MLGDGDVDEDGQAAADQMQASMSTIATVADNGPVANSLRDSENFATPDGKDVENSKQEESSSNLLFHPPAAHEEHSAGDSVKSDQLEQDCQIAGLEAEIAAEMKLAPSPANNLD